MNNVDVGKIIAIIRERKGMTQKELGEKIGKSKTTENNYETGETDIPLSSILRIAEELEVEPAILLGAPEDDFEPQVTIRAYREEDRRTLMAILGMNGYTVRQIKIARDGKKSSWYCVQGKFETGNLASQ